MSGRKRITGNDDISPFDWRGLLLMGVAAVSLVACTAIAPVPDPEEPTGSTATEKGLPAAAPKAMATLPGQQPQLEEVAESGAAPAELYRSGSGKFVKPPKPLPETPVVNGEVTLNFENTNVLEVIKVILGDLLGENYTVDPKVQGSVTLQTSRPLAKDALLPALELLLRSNGAALVSDGGLYRVVTLEDAVKAGSVPQLGGAAAPLPKGYGVRIVPLKHVAAPEMEKILTPLTHAGNVVRVDVPRNLLILAGTAREMERLLQTVDIFDVDWMAGMSFALFTPAYVDAKTLAGELENVFGKDKDGPLAGLVRLVPIERLNALLVVTPRPGYLKKVKDWVERLDFETAGSGRRLFVYHVQNGKAAELAEILTQVFEKDDSKAIVKPPQLAPGLEPAEIRSKAASREKEKRASTPGRAARVSSAAQEGLAVEEGSSVRIIADEVNNTLLILATVREYRQVKAALEKMDIVPLQVLIEATIAEIRLTDELEYGLQWYFKNNLDGGNKTGTGTLDLDAIPDIGAPIIPGFSYAITDAAGRVRAVLNMLAEESNVNIISSPSLMVLNNQTANINVGQQEPYQTRGTSDTASTIVDTTTVVATYEYRDTGVILTVTPRVNAGGLVTMEIEQEVSNVQEGTVGVGGNPIFLQRKIKSTVAIHGGQTVVLGGLIRENTDFSKSGIPVLYKLPIIGNLFGTTEDNTSRTELVVLITPRVVRDAAEALAVTDEFRHKMESLKAFQPYGSPEQPVP